MTTAVVIGEGSISGSLQGVELKSFKHFYQGMSPKISPGSSPVIVVDGRRFDDLNVFDENFSTDVETKKIEEFPNFSIERTSFGVSSEYAKDTVLQDFFSSNAISFIENETGPLFPRVSGITSYHQKQQRDAIIEPLTIRGIVDFSSIDFPEPHCVRGALSNAAEDVRRRGNVIVDFVVALNKSEPYLDENFAQDSLCIPSQGYLSDPIDVINAFQDGTDWEDTAAELQGEIASNIQFRKVSKEQMFPRGTTSATCGVIVDLSQSPGTDSITFAGLKR